MPNFYSKAILPKDFITTQRSEATSGIYVQGTEEAINNRALDDYTFAGRSKRFIVFYNEQAVTGNGAQVQAAWVEEDSVGDSSTVRRAWHKWSFLRTSKGSSVLLRSLQLTAMDWMMSG